MKPKGTPRFILQTPILKTKLYIPPTRPGLISRPRLYNKLDAGLKPGCPLILISAPAGFGKTVLLSSWISEQKIPIAWLGLDDADNDPLRFWRHVIAALQTIQAASAETEQIALEAVQAFPQDVLVTSLLNDLTKMDSPALLVLEDYHLVENITIHDGINFLLNHLPPQFHMAITTRSDPPLQIARRRADMGLAEIRASDLRFNREESISFLNDTMKLGLSPEDITALEARTEGWIVGLQMAALSMQGRKDKHAFIASFTGDDRYIADYLLEEVLQRQTADIQSFLLRTSVLNRLNASLCDAILEPEGLSPEAARQTDQAAGKNRSVMSSQEILKYLEQSNLFIVPLDNRREWFRYHHLFTSLLSQRLFQIHGRQEIQAIQNKACHWFEVNGVLPEAVEYALDCGDFENASRLISMSSTVMFERSEFNTVLIWAEKLPADLLISQPGLCAMFAWAAVATGHPQQTEQYLNMIERSVGATTDAFIADQEGFGRLPAFTQRALIEVSVIRARMVLDQLETRRSLVLAQLALPYLTPEQNKQPYLFNLPYTLRPPLLLTMGLAYKIDGNVMEANKFFSDANDLALELNNIHVSAISMNESGQILVLQGRLKDAEASFQKALRYSEQLGERTSSYFCMSFIGLSGLAYEWNDLESARRYLQEGIKLARIWNTWEAIMPGYLGLAQVQAAQGYWQEAFATIDELEKIIEILAPKLLVSIEAVRARLRIAQGDLGSPVDWAKSAGLDEEGEIDEKYEAEYLILARIFHGQGKSSQALKLLERLKELAESGERWGRAIQIMAFEAVVLESCGPLDEATDTLLAAMELAEPQRYLRTFIDEGQPMKDLLKYMHTAKKISKDDSGLLGYLKILLTAFDEVKTGLPDEKKASEQSLQPLSPKLTSSIEPLSKREQDVLRLMAGGASNSEIAHQLFLSINTVKKHISNIFDKLDVTTRVQAIEKGRRLGYLKS